MTPTALDQQDASPARRAGLVSELIDDETVIYDPHADQLHHLDPSATAVWLRLDGARSWRVVARDIAAAFGVAEELTRTDVTSLAVTLADRGLLADRGPSADSGVSRPVARPAPSRLPPMSNSDHSGPLPLARHVIGPFRGLEHSFTIATDDPAVATWLNDVLADLREANTCDVSRYEMIGTESHHVVRFDGEPVLVTGRQDRAVAALLWHINNQVYERSTPHYPVVHAAAAVKNGVTVLMPAAPESGKTTTVAGLVCRAGFGYVTDEAVGIDPATLLPRPYRKPLSIDRGSWAVLPELRPAHPLLPGQWQVPVGPMRPAALGPPAPIRFVVEPAYDPGANTTLQRVTRATMLMRLADSAFNFPSAPERNLGVLARVLERAECYQLPVSDLAQAVTLIDDLCSLPG